MKLFASLNDGLGAKADEGKPRFDLIPPEVPFALAHVLTAGLEKYAPRNWERGMTWGRCFAAMMRHLWSWWGGAGPTGRNFVWQDEDPETHYSHLWHALTCLAFLIAFEERGHGTDDRPGVALADTDTDTDIDTDITQTQGVS